jgi:predicted nucleotidyltransferase
MVSTIFTQKELEVIEKKLKNKKLTQVDSNYLTRFIRPKLKEIKSIDSGKLLDKLEYNQKIISIDKIIIKIVMKNLPETASIVLFGSIIQNNYKNYNDIDIILVTRKNLFQKDIERWKKIKQLKEIFKKKGLNTDIQILSKPALEYNAARNIDLIYQLKDSKIIYGRINLPKKNKQVYNADLHMKLDWSDIINLRPKGEEIYKAIRNAVLVRLLLRKIVDNSKLIESLNDEIGKNLAERLRNNQESKVDRKIALNFLKELVENTRKEIKGGLWEKIILSQV